MHKTPLYASMTDDLVLPVIDVTHPSFTLNLTESEVAAMAEEYAAQMSGGVPPHILDSLRQSTLGRAVMEASGTFLGGLATYRMKLGPDNLGTDASPIDRLIAASLPAVAMRLRLQDVSELLADGLLNMLASDPSRPILLVNLGGGVGADSWNALLRINAVRPEMLFNRQTTIAVLDVDEQGPAFGVRATDALSEPDGPLHRVQPSFRHFRYNWSQTNELLEIFSHLRADHCACLISSEGALFEYGSDEEIVANLNSIHAVSPQDAIIAGSVTRAGVRNPGAAMAIRPRSIEAFGSLAEQAKWRITRVIERPFSYNVAMAKA